MKQYVSVDVGGLKQIKMDSNLVIKTELPRHHFYGLCSKSQSLFTDFEEFPVDLSNNVNTVNGCRPTGIQNTDSKAAKQIWLGFFWLTINTSCELDGMKKLGRRHFEVTKQKAIPTKCANAVAMNL